jgi:hypothetical protein
VNIIEELAPKVLPAGWRALAAQCDGTLWVRFAHRSGLHVIVSVDEAPGERWLHVSCSYVDHLPSWGDLKAVKTIFIGRENEAWQFLAPESEWVDDHEFTLHLWHRLDEDSVELDGPSMPPSPEVRRGHTATARPIEAIEEHARKLCGLIQARLPDDLRYGAPQPNGGRGAPLCFCDLIADSIRREASWAELPAAPAVPLGNGEDIA